MVTKVEALIYREGNVVVNSSSIDGSEDQLTAQELQMSQTWRALLLPHIRWPLFIGIFVASFQQLTGINAIIIFSKAIFEEGREGQD